jgi:tetratricopeptide (TPR) repeat protein
MRGRSHPDSHSGGDGGALGAPRDTRMHLRGDQLKLGPERGLNLGRILVLVALIGGGLFLLQMRESGQVQPLFLPTQTATRTVKSFEEEATARVSAGNLPGAIAVYQQALEVNPDDATLWAELARIQTYSSALQASNVDRLARLTEARQSIDRATQLAPDDGFIRAIRARVYDWSASAYQGDDKALFDEYLTEADQSARQAGELVPNSALANTFKAEVAVDQGNYLTAYDLAKTAVDQIESGTAVQSGSGSPDLDAIDVYWVFGIVSENNGDYRAAIATYQKAIQINPNLTFLYLRLGTNYRKLAGNAINLTERRNLVDQSLTAFDRAAKINEQNGVQDPIPYLAIGRTYLQEGEFFIAARNVERAVLLDKGNPALYGFLGEVYYRARNYESALQVLKCSVEGCDAQQIGDLLCNGIQIINCDLDTNTLDFYGQAVPGLPLDSGSLEYYYTYASALAYLSGSAGYESNCQIAEGLFTQLMASYGNDPTVAAIVADNQAICASSASGTRTPAGTVGPETSPTVEPSMQESTPTSPNS